MRHRIRFAFAAFVVLCSTTVGHAIPQLINYQGVLTDGLGDPVTTATTVQFRIWNADVGGIELWTESQLVNPNTSGVFTVLLGSVNPIPDTALAGDQTYLGVTISPDVEMTPRARLVASAYAFRVSTLEGAAGGRLTGPIIIQEAATRALQPPGDAEFILVNLDGDSLYLSPLYLAMKDNLGYEQFTVTNDPGQGSVLGIRLDGTESADHSAVTSSWSSTGAKSYRAQAKKTQIGSQGMFLYGNTDIDTIVTVIEESSGVPEVRLTDQNAVAATETRTIQIGGQDAGGSVIVAVTDALGNKITETTVDANGSAELAFYDVGAAKANAPSPKKMSFTRDGLLVFGATDTDTALVIQSETGNIFGRGQVAMGQLGTLSANKSARSPSAIWSTVFGFNNTASGDSSTVSGGYQNTASGFASTIGGGAENVSAGQQSTVGGGWACTTNGYVTTVSGGYLNTASGLASSVGGGHTNSALDWYATVAGGVVNTADGWAFVGGGGWNEALGYGSAIAGGSYGEATGNSAFIGSGYYNKARGAYSVVAGGGGGAEIDSNAALGLNSMIPGGRRNVAGGNYSFAAGRRAQAMHGGSFVWADSTDADFASTGANQFLIRANGGVGIGTTSPGHMLDVNGSVHAGGGLRVDGGSSALNTSASNSEGNAVIGATSPYSNVKLNVVSNQDFGMYLEGGASTMLYCVGNAGVTGTLSKGAGSFKIDHPLDPDNKYLLHSFVESPDMMNVYNGNVVLDGGGRANVQMPEYFEALNRDFRYQLTSIGAPGPNLYIATEIANGQFSIAGGAPGAKVSWQVTGVRQDAFANANRIEVEVDKTPEDRGHYLHPEALGQSPSLRINHTEVVVDATENTVK